MRVKDWQEDVRVARAGGREAAALPTAAERLEALRNLFGAIGEASTRYADHLAAVRFLVRQSVRAYQEARKEEK